MILNNIVKFSKILYLYSIINNYLYSTNLTEAKIDDDIQYNLCLEPTPILFVNNIVSSKFSQNKKYFVNKLNSIHKSIKLYADKFVDNIDNSYQINSFIVNINFLKANISEFINTIEQYKDEKEICKLEAKNYFFTKTSTIYNSLRKIIIEKLKHPEVKNIKDLFLTVTNNFETVYLEYYNTFYLNIN